MTKEINYFKTFVAAFCAVACYHVIGSILNEGSINSIDRKLDALNSRIPPIQLYEGNVLGNTNSERFVQLDGIRFYSHVEGKSVEDYVNEENNLRKRLEELR